MSHITKAHGRLSRATTSVVVACVMFFLATYQMGCGADSPLDPCRTCQGGTFTDSLQICYQGEVCRTNGCAVESIACVAHCTTTADCEAGHACVAYEGAFVCSPYCDDSLCPERHVCVDGAECLEVPCTTNAHCPGGFCHLHRCYPTDGACQYDFDCPDVVPTSVAASVTCREGYCRIDSAPIPAIQGLSATASVVIQSPASVNPYFKTQEEIAFSWDASGNAAILLVLKDVPTHSSEILANAIWGAYRSQGAKGEAHWADGVAIRNGTWQSKPDPVPMDVPLFLVVQAVQNGELIAISPVTLFRVGAPWPQPGDACDPDISPSSCTNPALPEICKCSVGQCRCAELCASTAECTLCEVPATLDAPRTCGIVSP